MRIVGFSFTKMSAERLGEGAENIKINTELDIPELKEVKSNLISPKENLLEANFEYRVLYEPNLAKIIIGGRILFTVPEKEAKEITAQWKKKTLSEELRIPLFNIVMKKSALKALNLSDELNLPIHIPFPTIRKNENTKD